jgi:hypothetical protein
MEAVFQPENFRIFSGDLRAFSAGKNGTLARNQWKKSEDFLVGIRHAPNPNVRVRLTEFGFGFGFGSGSGSGSVLKFGFGFGLEVRVRVRVRS